MKPDFCYDADSAVKDVFDGATIAISGYCGVGLPLELAEAISRKKVKDLTIITLAFGIAAKMIERGGVKKVITTMPRVKFGRAGESSYLNDVINNSGIEIELVNQVTLLERLKAGASDIAAFYTPVGADTEMAAGKETRVIDGKTHVLEYAIKPDFAICRVNCADTLGNVNYNRSFKNITHELAMAGRKTIVQADKMVTPGSFDPNLSGCFVHKIVKTREVMPSYRISNIMKNDPESDAIGQRVAADLPSKSLIEVGMGLPWFVVNHVDHSKDITLHAEGVYGVNRVLDDDEPDTDFRGPTSEVIDVIPGGHTMTFTESFNVIMRGLVDVALIGTFQVDVSGTFANWKIPDGDRMPTVGAGMELATHAKQVWILTKHFDSQGKCKIVDKCTYPVTAYNVVKRIYTELCTLEVTDQGLKVLDIVGEMTHEELEKISNMKFIPKDSL